MKRIPLAQNKFSLVDDDDFERLSRHKWKFNHGYAARSVFVKGSKPHRWTIELMHRVVMNVPKGVLIDHINLDSLDNRKENLRFCDKSENAKNVGKRKDNLSGFKGVCKGPYGWRAYIFIDGKQKSLGTFNNSVQAARAYDKAAKRLFGSFAFLNFPEGEKCTSFQHSIAYPNLQRLCNPQERRMSQHLEL